MVSISYEKFRILMVKRKMQWKDIRVQLKFNPRTITKLKNDEVVDLEILMRISDYFKCDISDLVEFIHTDTDKK